MSLKVEYFKADSHIACRDHAVPLPCRAAKGLQCVFPIWFTHCGRVWSTLPCHAHAMLRPCRSSQGHSTARPSRDGRTVPWPWENGMIRAWHGRGMASVNQTRPHCVNQMGKTYSKPLAARHGRGTAWARYGHGILCVNRPLVCPFGLCTVTPMWKWNRPLLYTCRSVPVLHSFIVFFELNSVL